MHPATWPTYGAADLMGTTVCYNPMPAMRLLGLSGDTELNRFARRLVQERHNSGELYLTVFAWNKPFATMPPDTVPQWNSRHALEWTVLPNNGQIMDVADAIIQNGELRVLGQFIEEYFGSWGFFKELAIAAFETPINAPIPSAVTEYEPDWSSTDSAEYDEEFQL